MSDLTPHPLDQDAPPSVVINPHSELGRELRKWEQHYTHLTPPGTNPGNPYVYRPYPRMLYKAHKRSNGQYACMLPAPEPYAFEKADAYQRAVLEKDTFDRTCQRIVKSEEDERLALGQGWSQSPQDALKLAEAHEQSIANAAAEAAYAVQRMSEKAQAEYRQADAATDEHVTDVTPQKRGRSRSE